MIIGIISDTLQPVTKKRHIGLIKSFELFPNFFPQIQPSLEKKFLLKDYFRSISMYEEFSTLAIFDVLPITGSLLDYYDKLVKVSTTKPYLIKKNNASTKKNLIIFVFADIKLNKTLTLDHPGSAWKVSLIQNNRTIYPNNITLLKNEPFIQRILSANSKFDRLKKIYRIEFVLDQNLLTSKQHTSVITFSYQDLKAKIDLSDIIKNNQAS